MTSRCIPTAWGDRTSVQMGNPLSPPPEEPPAEHYSTGNCPRKPCFRPWHIRETEHAQRSSLPKATLANLWIGQFGPTLLIAVSEFVEYASCFRGQMRETLSGPSRRSMRYKGKRILAIVPARGGVQRILRRNLASLTGHRSFTMLLCVSERPAVSLRNHHCGLDRGSTSRGRVGEPGGSEAHPTLSAGDENGTGVDQHCARFEATGKNYDAVLLLQRTTLFRKTETLSKALGLFFEKDTDSVVTVSPVPTKFNPYKGDTIEDGLLKPFSSQTGMLRRNQDTPTLYVRRPGLLYQDQPG